MRNLLLKIPSKFTATVIISLTIIFAFLIAYLFSKFFDTHQLSTNTELISSIYQVMGTLYAVLITFILWGVWQNYTEASNAAQNEAYALIDLIHMMDSSANLQSKTMRQLALVYSKHVIENEWYDFKNSQSNKSCVGEYTPETCSAIIKLTQGINPTNDREVVLFGKTMTLLSAWLDARRTRLLIAKGNSAKALWPLLLSGAFVLFAFHGLFVAKTIVLWTALLVGFSYFIGLTFYLIFALDCPFSGKLGVDAEVFQYVINLLTRDEVATQQN